MRVRKSQWTRRGLGQVLGSYNADRPPLSAPICAWSVPSPICVWSVSSPTAVTHLCLLGVCRNPFVLAWSVPSPLQCAVTHLYCRHPFVLGVCHHPFVLGVCRNPLICAWSVPSPICPCLECAVTHISLECIVNMLSPIPAWNALSPIPAWGVLHPLTLGVSCTHFCLECAVINPCLE